ncbi:MAG: DUF4870 family protein [Betaproteobacteria bacterium]
MNDVIDVPGDGERERSLKTVGHISYLLHTVVAVGAALPGVQASVALLVVAFILDLVKKSDAEGTWQASHFAYRIRTVLWAAALYLITAPLFVLFLVPGMVAWALIGIWFLYRIVRGWMNLNAGKPMEP